MTPDRVTVRIPTASGDELEAWIYRPESRGPHPAVVMAHGFGAVKACGLAAFAERFRHAGFAAIDFDYDVYEGGEDYDRVVNAEVEFLYRHARTLDTDAVRR
jgi:dienelactone hydrolase